MLEIYKTWKYTHCIHVNTDFKARQMLPTDQLQVFDLNSLAHRIAFSDFEASLKMRIIDYTTREHAVTYTNRDPLLCSRRSLSWIYYHCILRWKSWIGGRAIYWIDFVASIFIPHKTCYCVNDDLNWPMNLDWHQPRHINMQHLITAY